MKLVDKEIKFTPAKLEWRIKFKLDNGEIEEIGDLYESSSDEELLKELADKQIKKTIENRKCEF